jgi:hypothetical protein
VIAAGRGKFISTLGSISDEGAAEMVHFEWVSKNALFCTIDFHEYECKRLQYMELRVFFPSAWKDRNAPFGALLVGGCTT